MDEDSSTSLGLVDISALLVNFPLSHRQSTAIFSGEFKRFESALILERLKLAGSCRSIVPADDHKLDGQSAGDADLFVCRPNAELVCVLAHKCVLHPDSLAKYAAAFFRMSRSSVTRRSSAFTRRNSAA